MISVVGYECFSKRIVEALHIAERVVAVLPDVSGPPARVAGHVGGRTLQTLQDVPQLLRCHEVARVVAWFIADAFKEQRQLRAIITDGQCGTMQHSWIGLLDTEAELEPHPALKYRNDEHEPAPVQALLDPYCVGRLPQVQLISPTMGHARLYSANVTGHWRSDIDEAVVTKLIAHVKEQLPLAGRRA